MQEIKLDMAVLNCDNVKIGKIGAVHPCCFEVMHNTDTERTNLTSAALIDVDNGSVRLSCGAFESLQFACPTHSPAALDVT
jgi:hypothetical protein